MPCRCPPQQVGCSLRLLVACRLDAHRLDVKAAHGPASCCNAHQHCRLQSAHASDNYPVCPPLTPPAAGRLFGGAGAACRGCAGALLPAGCSRAGGEDQACRLCDSITCGAAIFNLSGSLVHPTSFANQLIAACCRSLCRPRCAASRGGACQRQRRAAGRGHWL